MAIRRNHVLHMGAMAAVLIQLGFAGAFLTDAITANDTYDALAAHHVAVPAEVVGCSSIGYGRYSNYGRRMCYVDASYRGYQFRAYIPSSQSHTFYVDPADPAHHMSAASFDNGPKEVTGDDILAGILLAGAASVTVVHQAHLRRARRRRRAIHAEPRPG